MPPILSLPIDEILPRIVQSISHAPNLVLKAPTGAGKTVRVAPALLGCEAIRGQVVLLEPRRVAARAAARRIAFERGATLGDEIGYHVRFDRKAGSSTRLVAMTYGIFLQQLKDDPLAEHVGAVVFDEFHERSLDADLALALCRKVQREVRDDLRIVVMSATLDATPVARFLGDAPVVESTGRAYPVEIRHRAIDDPRSADRAVVAAVTDVLSETTGDVLVFLPGIGEIRRTHAALEEKIADRHRFPDIEIAELYGDLPAEQQDAVLRRGKKQRVVLATNVAESSVTIENISAVVDGGLARVMRFDPRVGVDRLEVARISRASADQRAGRAGRTGPGVCIRLWSAHDDRALRPSEEPEVRRVDLARALLDLRAWGEPDPAVFDWFEAPEPAALDAAASVLEMLGCVRGGRLTEEGRALSRLPLPPRIGRLLVGARRLGVVRMAAIAAALLTERDPFRTGRADASARRPVSAHESDVLERVVAIERFSRSPGSAPDLNAGAARSVIRIAQDLERLVRSDGGTSAASQDAEEHFLRALVAAFPDRIARRRAPGSDRALMVGGRGVRLASESVVASAELFVCVAVDAGRRGERAESLVRQASAIEREWLPRENVTRRIALEFDAQTETVTARALTLYQDLVLDEKPAAASREAAGEVLADHAASDPARALDLAAPETARWLGRARFVAESMPELGLPAFDDDVLGRVAREVAAGRRSFDEMRRAPVLDALRAQLTFEQLRAIDRHAPERIKVPSGSAIAVEYEPGRAPVVSVRIQEVFGMTETPRVAGGRVAIVMHLLAPNRRPEQVTDDLASFWRTTYADVRRELRARYPKHSWPEDPLTAEAEHRPRRKR